jgi:outer membrane receptor for ferrienterochelin and colicin
LDKWELYGCYIQNVAYGESNYATSEAQQITVTLRYDNAQHLGENGTPDLFTGGNVGNTTLVASANG